MKMQRIITLLTFVMIMFMASGGVSADVISELVAYYPFNGNANDESVNTNDGTVNGATLANDRFGNADSAYSFDGIDDYIDFGDDASLQFTGTPSMSVFGWAKLSGAGTFIGIDKYNSQGGSTGGANIGYYLAFFDTGVTTVVRAGFGDGVETKIDASTNINDGAWHLVGWTWDGSDVNIYVDGALDFTQPYTTSITDNSQALSLGKRIDLPTNLYTGLMDDIRIYNRALSSSDITELQNEPNPVPEPSTMLLLGSGLAGLGWYRRRRKAA